MELILFALGIVLLIKGADWLVDGSSALAKKFGVSSLIIGLTVVAFGTSAPELVVSLVSAFEGATDVAFGNVVGSNIANILLVLGVSAIILPPVLHRNTVWREVPFSLLATIILLVVANDFLIEGGSISSLGRIDGLILLAFFIVFLYYLFVSAQKSRKELSQKEIPIERHSNRVITVMIAGGVLGLYLGGRWVVEGAVVFASLLGASQFLISASVVAIGTSLPELVASVAAARRKDADLAIGNIVGSNIFNIFWILGAAAIVAPVAVPASINIDIVFLLLITILFFVFMFIGKRHELSRWQGVLFLILYLAYIVFIIARG